MGKEDPSLKCALSPITLNDPSSKMLKLEAIQMKWLNQTFGVLGTIEIYPAFMCICVSLSRKQRSLLLVCVEFSRSAESLHGPQGHQSKYCQAVGEGIM